MRFVLSFLLCFLVGACARPSGGNAPATKPVPPKPMPSPTPAPTPLPKDPEEFYRQFLFQLIGACGARTINYRYVDSESVVIAVNKHGQEVLVELSLLMYPDHTYKAYYEEIDIISYSAGGYYWKDSRFKTISGEWRVRQHRLELSGLGFAVPVEDPQRPMMLFSANYDLLTAGLKNHELTLRNILADYVPVRDADPCKKTKFGVNRLGSDSQTETVNERQ